MLKNKKKVYICKLYIYVNHAFKILALLPTHFSQNIFRKLVALTQSTLFTIWLSRSAVVHVGAWADPQIWLDGSKASEFGNKQQINQSPVSHWKWKLLGRIILNFKNLLVKKVDCKMNTLINDSNLNHIGYRVALLLRHDSLISLRSVNHGWKTLLDDPKFWLKKYAKKHSLDYLPEDWTK